MKSIFLFAALFTASAFASHAQDTTVLTRTPYKLHVAIAKNAAYEEDIKATPYILPGNFVQLYPGETVYAEVERDAGVIKSLKAVKENTNPSKTLVITFSQSVNNGAHEMMQLKIANPFSQTLVYKAKVIYLKGHKWIDTDVLPIQAGLSGIEMWPDIITVVALTDWTLQVK